MERQLVHLAHARSGDKGDKADISLFAYNRASYDLLAHEVTAERVREHFSGLITSKVERFEAPNLLALKFVLHGALNGGASRSLRSDSLGKSLASALLRMKIEWPEPEASSRLYTRDGEEASSENDSGAI